MADERAKAHIVEGPALPDTMSPDEAEALALRNCLRNAAARATQQRLPPLRLVGRYRRAISACTSSRVERIASTHSDGQTEAVLCASEPAERPSNRYPRVAASAACGARKPPTPLLKAIIRIIHLRMGVGKMRVTTAGSPLRIMAVLSDRHRLGSACVSE